MKKNIGLWIDHRQAVIVMASATGEEIKEILSNTARQPGRIDGERSHAAFEEVRDHFAKEQPVIELRH